MGRVFRKIRAIDDRTLYQVLGGQDNALRGVSAAVWMLLRERRLLLALTLVQTGAIIWLVLR